MRGTGPLAGEHRSISYLSFVSDKTAKLLCASVSYFLKSDNSETYFEVLFSGQVLIISLCQAECGLNQVSDHSPRVPDSTGPAVSLVTFLASLLGLEKTTGCRVQTHVSSCMVYIVPNVDE